jgi:hypothetical protein
MATSDFRLCPPWLEINELFADGSLQLIVKHGEWRRSVTINSEMRLRLSSDDIVRYADQVKRDLTHEIAVAEATAKKLLS